MQSAQIITARRTEHRTDMLWVCVHVVSSARAGWCVCVFLFSGILDTL